MIDPPPGGPARRPAGPTRREIVQGVRRELELAGLESPRVEAERLVAAALSLSVSELGLSGGERVDPGAAADVARAVSRRLEGQPLQHIEGTVDFRRVRLVSDGRALIPRPETEQLLDLVAAWRRGRDAPVDALDIGVGSGAIALALLDEGIAGRVVGLDVSEDALDQARENARRQTADGLELRLCPPDIWSALEPGETFDLIISNPPYVTTPEWTGLDPVVRDHEPRVALDGGEDGLDVIRTVVSGAAAHLREGGALFLEIATHQAPAVLALLEAEPILTDSRVRTDLAARPRFASARKAGSD
ncbi:MAG: peptide chain release factor N(5)-glutamine methyltransferase [Gemmatimonadota bacterium]|uniref:peptide chain release factor N(5)-glutamine methyltransferase n=1 Tax=Candidatus Palauibacter scopulicola TaxID=3056741 RepID=UPI00239BBD3D|nr:peptide chain release factor N(5)-glutamine methyltransferase [Candidatus Palauibacter scopulicola]MDE2663887.1 peptide chain release factor N(5)-glutamine methyltransferase [Candidatus Palauibacter scopulicola]